MISPALEKMILRGEAEYNLHVQGNASGRIVVPSDKTVVVTDIWYYHFVDADANEVDPNRPWNDRSVHQMLIYSDKKYDRLVIRESLIKNDNTDGVTTVRNKNVFGQSHFDLYLMHVDDIYIEITGAPPVNTWPSIAFEETPNVSELQPVRPPRGYGKGPFPGGVRYPIQYDMTADFRVKAYRQRSAPPIQSSYEGLAFPVNGVTALRPPVSSASGVMQYPIVNIGYVTINNKSGFENL